MKSWLADYRSRICTPEEAVRVVKSGDRVFLNGNGAAPIVLMDALAQRRDELHSVELVHLLLLGDLPFAKPEMEGHFRHNSLFVGSGDRPAINAGRGDAIPIHLSHIPSLFRDDQLPLDVAIVHLAPPNDDGFCSLGIECATTRVVIEKARTVVAQINDRMPFTLGDTLIHYSELDNIVEVSDPLILFKQTGASDVEEKIAQLVAPLITDGCTIQLGIGAIPDAVMAKLDGIRDVGVHTEMVSDGVIRAIEKGIITNRKKTLHPGKCVATFALGSEELYKYIHRNMQFEFYACDYTNNPFVIAQNEKMVAINSAIEVDITGQVCADSIGPRVYSGVGGQVDFVRGAIASKGGKSIIALPSTAKNGTVSRIVPTLRYGAGVVTSRADVHYVVTEFGVAHLRGKNFRQRAEELIQVAHPAFRDELMDGVRKLQAIA